MKNKKKMDDNGFCTFVRMQPSGNSEIMVCPVKWCNFLDLDAMAVGERLNAVVEEMEFEPGVLIGISGCMQDCSKVFLKDIGLLAKDSAWSVTFGGSNASGPRYGDIVTHGRNEEEAVELVRKCIVFYTSHAHDGETTSGFLKRMGMEAIQDAVL